MMDMLPRLRRARRPTLLPSWKATIYDLRISVWKRCLRVDNKYESFFLDRLEKMENCPICLDCVEADDKSLCMPVCMHRVHTVCALKAAQYDSRCPVCRTREPTLTSRQEDDLEMYANIERIANEQEIEVRRYQQRRARVIRKHSRLRHIRDRLNDEKKRYASKEKELERTWVQMQRECWKSNEAIQRLKQERRVHQRRTNSLCKKLDNEVETILGPKPEDIILSVNIP